MVWCVGVVRWCVMSLGEIKGFDEAAHKEREGMREVVVLQVLHDMRHFLEPQLLREAAANTPPPTSDAAAHVVSVGVEVTHCNDDPFRGLRVVFLLVCGVAEWDRSGGVGWVGSGTPCSHTYQHLTVPRTHSK